MTKRFAIAAVLAVLVPGAALAQSNPGLRQGQVPTAAQWNSYFAAKQDFLGSAPITSLTGDVTATGPGAAAATLATVNTDVGTWGTTTQVGRFTVNGKGLITAVSNVTLTPAIGSISGLGTGVATFLATPSSANLAAAVTGETGTGALVFANAPALTGAVTLAGTMTGTSASATCFLFGPNGATNPTLAGDCSASSGATGFKISNAAAGSAATLAVTSSGTNESAVFLTKGTGVAAFRNGVTGSNLVLGSGTISGFNYEGLSTDALAFGAGFATYPHILFGIGTPLDQETIYGVPTGWSHTFAVNGTTKLLISGTGTTITGATIAGATITGSFTATGLVTNAALVSAVTTVNGTACTLGSTCTITAVVTGVTIGTTTITSGTTNQLLYDNAGVIGEVTKGNNCVYGTNGTGVPSCVTTLPSAVTASSLTSVGTLSSLAVTGVIVGTSASSAALVYGPNGATNPAFRVNASGSTGATGFEVANAAVGSAATLSVISSGANESMVLAPKGTGLVDIRNGIASSDMIIGTGIVNGFAYMGITTNVLTFNFATFANYPHILTGVGSPLDNGWIYGIPTGGYHSFEINSIPSLVLTSSLATVSVAIRYGGVTLSNAVTGTGNMVLSASPTFTGTIGGNQIFSGTVIVNAQANTTDGGGFSIGGAAKNVFAGSPVISMQSNDASNKFSGTLLLAGDPTAGNRRLIIQATESGVGFRNISMAESGGAVVINRSNGLVLTASDLLSVAGQVTFNSLFYLSGLTTAAGTPNSICQNNSTKEIVVNAALTCTVSSRDFKTEPKEMGSALADLRRIRPVEFAYRDAPDRSRWGFIAEELAEVDRNLADGWDRNGVPRSIDQNAIIARLVKAAQEMLSHIDALETRH